MPRSREKAFCSPGYTIYCYFFIVHLIFILILLDHDMSFSSHYSYCEY